MKNSSFFFTLWKHRKLIIFIVPIFLAIGIDVFVITFHRYNKQAIIPAIHTSSQSVSQKIWQITFKYDLGTGVLTITNISVKKGNTLPSSFQNSPYRLFVLNSQQQILFQTDIHIAQQILYNVYFPPGTSASDEELPQPQQLTTVVAIPYFTDATTILVTQNGTEILRTTAPKEITMQLIQQAFANICSKLHIIFISDGYTDMNKFHQDALHAENTFKSKEPFASNKDIFDFQIVDNPVNNPLGCKKNNALFFNCVGDAQTLTKAIQLVSDTFPDLPIDDTYTKIVILVDALPEQIGKGYVLGVANTLGGQFGVFQNRLFFEQTATMEVLGHDVGQLYDRYLYPPSSQASQIGGAIAAPFLTNCTTNPQGELFWKNAGATQAYKGCTSNYLYAPAPRDCGDGGSSTTIMSQTQCGGSQFDAVEQYWLKTNIIPIYKCTPPAAISPTTSFATPSNVSPSPHVIPLSPTGNISSAPTNANPSGQIIDCQPDPGCASGKNTLQLCPLKCTAK